MFVQYEQANIRSVYVKFMGFMIQELNLSISRNIVYGLNKNRATRFKCP